MEFSLEKLDRQEQKYTAELDAALAQYTELRQQTFDFDAAELAEARQVIRLNKELEAVQQLQAACGKKLDSSLLAQSRKDVAVLMDETAEPVSIKQQLQQKQQPVQDQRNHEHER